MQKTTKKMAATKKELANESENQRIINAKLTALDEFQVTSAEGKKAKDVAIETLLKLQGECHERLRSLSTRLELETIAMVTGEDVDMAEPTPAEALHRAV